MFKITLKQCAYFVAVAEQGGIAQAARVLNISQPAVAQAIDKLEDLFDFRLFERHHAQGTELTPQGRSFIQSARNLLLQAENTEHQAKAIADDLVGVIRFGCFHSIAPFYLAHILQSYKHTCPGAEILSTELRQDELIAEVESGKLDIALTYDMSLSQCSLDRQTVAKLKPFVLLGESHALASKPSVSFADLATEPYVMFEGPSSRDYFESLLEIHGINPPVSFNSKSMESVRSAVANGLGFSLSVMKVPHKDTYDGGRVVSVPIKEKVNPLPIVLITRGEAKQWAQLVKFSEFCSDYFASAHH